jgi:hypothetical protein
MIQGILVDKKDRFGPLEYIIHDIIVPLPRRPVSETRFIAADKIILNFSGIEEQYNTECYSAVPFSANNTVSKMDAMLTIKQYIWNNFFGLSKNCMYYENCHYPIALRYNLKNKLHIKDIDSLENLQEFISHVMNAIFDRVIYVYDSILLAAANDICKGIVKMDNIVTYKIRENYRYWLEK